MKINTVERKWWSKFFFVDLGMPKKEKMVLTWNILNSLFRKKLLSHFTDHFFNKFLSNNNITFVVNNNTSLLDTFEWNTQPSFITIQYYCWGETKKKFDKSKQKKNLKFVVVVAPLVFLVDWNTETHKQGNVKGER